MRFPGALQAYAGIVASLLLAGAKAELSGTLMEREHLDEQEAFTHLRRAARSSGRKLSAAAGESRSATACGATARTCGEGRPGMPRSSSD
jgi:hypothetical protein